MNPKKIINIKLRSPNEKIAFLERLEGIGDIEFSVTSKENSVRIKIYGTREQISEFIKLTKTIQKELAGEDHEIEDIERE